MKRAVLLLRSLTVLVWAASLVLAASTSSQAKAAAVFSAYGIRVGDQRVGVVLLDLDGSPNPSNVSSVRDILEGQGRRPYSVQQYYDETTRGEIHLDFEVVGPFSVAAAWCDHASIAAAGNAALALDGGDPGQYDAMMYITEEAPEGGCRYRGGSYQGGYRADTNTIVLYGHQGASLIVHELGHMLGLEHADRYKCGYAQAISENCSIEKGGDPTDLMGHALTAKLYYNFNAPHKVALGIIPEDEVKIVKKSGTYTIIGSEIDQRGTHVLRIKASDEAFGANAYFLIEYRQPLHEFAKSMKSEFVVTAWTEDITEPTYYVGSLDCHREHCGSLALSQGTQTITITALSEGTGEGTVSIEMTDATGDAG